MLDVPDVRSERTRSGLTHSRNISYDYLKSRPDNRGVLNVVGMAKTCIQIFLRKPGVNGSNHDDPL